MQLAGEPTEDEKRKKFADSANDLLEYFEMNKIFFSKELASKVDSVLQKIREIWIDYQTRSYHDKSDISYLEIWGRAWKKIQEQLPVLKMEIEEEFRTIMGASKY